MSELFREVMVWERLDDREAVRFCCLENLDSRMFAVQSADFFCLPLREGAPAQMFRQFIELFIEISPVERCAWFGSLAEAIADHKRKFS
jgi:hypothetical protein